MEEVFLKLRARSSVPIRYFNLYLEKGRDIQKELDSGKNVCV
jgi:hypothetical protein